ncbi:MAG TPA: hypothetical protein VHN13_11025 [Candidatus Tectomicrobia bacterium]|nr:hypothetical protein [Candidatus Tectomicrobia bacterium]
MRRHPDELWSRTVHHPVRVTASARPVPSRPVGTIALGRVVEVHTAALGGSRA